MAKIGDIFRGQGGAPPATEPAVSERGQPPGDQRYGKELPLTDRYAGRTLAELLAELGQRANPEQVMKQLRPTDGGGIYQTRVAADTVYLRPLGAQGGQPGQAPQLAPENLVVLPQAQAMALIKGGEPRTLLGGRRPQPMERPTIGVGTPGPRLGPPGGM